MTADTSQDVAPWRYKLQAVLVLLTGVVGAIAGAVLVFFDYRNNSEFNSYQSAAQRARPADALNADKCRYVGPATVTETTLQSVLSVDVTFAGLPGHAFVATFPTGREPDQQSLRTGATVSAELWNGLVTEVAGVKSVQDPEFLPKNFAPASWGLLVAGAGFAVVTALTLVRRAWSLPPG